jgi:hypothetical protein
MKTLKTNEELGAFSSPRPGPGARYGSTRDSAQIGGQLSGVPNRRSQENVVRRSALDARSQTYSRLIP